MSEYPTLDAVPSNLKYVFDDTNRPTKNVIILTSYETHKSRTGSKKSSVCSVAITRPSHHHVLLTSTTFSPPRPSHHPMQGLNEYFEFTSLEVKCCLGLCALAACSSVAEMINNARNLRRRFGD